MKKQRGFTIVELAVVILIISLLLSIVTLYFSRMNQKYEVESTVKEIYSVLMRARNDAASSNTPHIALLNANQVLVGADANGDNAIDGDANIVQLDQFALNFTVSPIVFDRRGVTTNTQTLRITGFANVTPFLDCLVIANTRINMGRFEGGVCAQQ